eukprot:5302171-Amphidinium_carterae.1
MAPVLVTYIKCVGVCLCRICSSKMPRSRKFQPKPHAEHVPVSATALSPEEFPVVFGAIALVSGMAHAMLFAIGYMLCERACLSCSRAHQHTHTRAHAHSTSLG